LLALISLIFLNSTAQDIDLLLKGGQVIDPKNGINTLMDVAIKDGKIHSLASNIPATQS
jgi:dihydroorotase